MSVLYNLWAQLPSAGLLWAGSQESRFPNITVTETPGLPKSLFSLYEAFQSSYLNSPDLKSTKKNILTQTSGGMDQATQGQVSQGNWEFRSLATCRAGLALRV